MKQLFNVRPEPDSVFVLLPGFFCREKSRVACERVPPLNLYLLPALVLLFVEPVAADAPYLPLSVLREVPPTVGARLEEHYLRYLHLSTYAQ